MQNIPDPYASQSKVNKTYLGIGVGLLIVGLIFGLWAAGVLGFGSGGNQVATKAGRPISSPVTSASKLPSAPITQATTDTAPVTQATKKTMPKEIMDWLKHLEATEKKRSEQTTAAMAELMVQQTYLTNVGGTEDMVKALFGDDSEQEIPDPAKELEKQGRDHNKGWQELIEFFDSVPPPAECVPIRNAYSQCIGETRAMYTEILDVMSNSSSDPKAAVAKLMQMKGKSSERIDVAAKESDHLVQKICDEYDTWKWFGISSS